ncbi:MAG: pyruvate kinase, partial [Candidatus Fermentibacteria bacterium]
MKKTKIVATISDVNCSEELIRSLFKSGMNVVRLNSAHQSIEGALKIVNTVRAVSSRIALMMDTK